MRLDSVGCPLFTGHTRLDSRYHSNIVHYLQQMCLDIALLQSLQSKYAVSTNVNVCVMCSEISSPTCKDTDLLSLQVHINYGVVDRRGPA